MPDIAYAGNLKDDLSPELKRVMKQRQVIAALAGIAFSLLLRLLPVPASPPGPRMQPYPLEIVNYMQAVLASRVVRLAATAVFTFLAVYRWCYPRAWLYAFLAGLGWTGAILSWLMRG